jgi:copper chaperone CopZ
MSCQHCVAAVQRALEGVDGVAHARVDLDGASAEVECDDARTDPRALEAAVAEEGYHAEVDG